MVLYMYIAPGQGPLGCKLFLKHKLYVNLSHFYNFSQLNDRVHVSTWKHRGLVVKRRTPEREVEGFDPHSGRRVLSLSKIHLPPKNTGNTQEAVASS